MADLTMLTLLDRIVAFLTTDIGTGAIDTDVRLVEGISNDLNNIAKTTKKWISIDDGGESTDKETPGAESSERAQNRTYRFLVEIGTRNYKDLKSAMRETFTLYNQVKASFESEANRQVTVALIFGREVTPITIESEDKYFTRIRSCIIQYDQPEDTIDRY